MRFLLLILIINLGAPAYSQLDENYEYSKEFIWGPNFNTNGGLLGGVAFRWSVQRNEGVYQTIGFEIVNVKHPKEFRYPSIQGTTFIFGKTNWLYSFRLQYGRERILFFKDKQQGVQINAGFAGGPSFGLVAPYFVQIGESEYTKYDPDEFTNPFSDILGPGRFLQGIGQSELAFGLNAKASASFEFGAFKNSVFGLEVGGLVELYNKEIVLVPTQSNRQFFPSAFATLYWGRRK